MSDTRRSSETRVGVDDDLLARFKNAREALPELVVGKPDLECFHRPEAEADEPAPACVRVHYGDWRVVSVDEVLVVGPNAEVLRQVALFPGKVNQQYIFPQFVQCDPKVSDGSRLSSTTLIEEGSGAECF